MASPLVGIVADDLTGAADAAAMFTRGGLSATVFLERPPTVAAAVAAAVADTRALPPDAAAAVSRDALRWVASLAPRCYFQKIDSFLRGNAPVAVQVCRELLPERLVAIAPAFPALGRVTIGGLQLHHLRPLEVTEAGRDPVAPARCSSLPQLFGSRHVDLTTVARGAEAIATAVAAAQKTGGHVLSFDAAIDQDLDALVAALPPDRTVWVGSAGIGASLARHWAPAGPAPPRPLGLTASPVLIVAGSASRITAEQIGRCLDVLGPLLRVVPVRPGATHRAGREAAAALAGGHSVLLRPETQLQGDPDPVSARAMAQLLAEAAGKAVEACRPRGGVILTGGDTAMAVCLRTGVRALQVVGEVVPAIPLSVAVGGALDQLPVITKGGAVGAPDDVLRCLSLAHTGATDHSPRGPGEAAPHRS